MVMSRALWDVRTPEIFVKEKALKKQLFTPKFGS